MLVDIQQLLDKLDFLQGNPNSTFDGHKAFHPSQFRLRYHHSLENTRNQVLFTVECCHDITRSIEQPLKWAIILPDIFPETSEFNTDAILEMASHLPKPVILSRRGKQLSQFLKSQHFEIGSWQNPDTFSSFDLLVCIGNAVHLSLFSEIAAKQVSFDKTLILFANHTITLKRAQLLAKSDFALTCDVSEIPETEIRVPVMVQPSALTKPPVSETFKDRLYPMLIRMCLLKSIDPEQALRH